jgi:hypothetical protein
MLLSTPDVDNVSDDDELFESMDPMETIKKALRKANMELIG